MPYASCHEVTHTVNVLVLVVRIDNHYLSWTTSHVLFQLLVEHVELKLRKVQCTFLNLMPHVSCPALSLHFCPSTSMLQHYSLFMLLRTFIT